MSFAAFTLPDGKFRLRERSTTHLSLEQSRPVRDDQYEVPLEIACTWGIGDHWVGLNS